MSENATEVNSPKTASVHVSRIIAKTGASNRTDADGDRPAAPPPAAVNPYFEGGAVAHHLGMVATCAESGMSAAPRS